MSVIVTSNSYGKSCVRLTKVMRTSSVHELFEIDAAIQLAGDFEASYTHGDNRNCIATDSMKNTVYVLAKENSFDSIEQFAIILADHFVATYPQVARATAELTASSWTRILVDGQPHNHAFRAGRPDRGYANAVAARNETTSLKGGVRGMQVLKTTDSEWKEFVTDRYRTLKDATDRILATTIDADWTFNTLTTDFKGAAAAIEGAMLRAFATQHSLGAQQTILHMGEAALEVCAEVDSIRFTLPNQHRIPFNLEPFGLQFENDIFVATDEPHGLIHGTVARSK